METTNGGIETFDRAGTPVRVGESVRILAVTPDSDMDEDERDMIDHMVGSVCEVERIDAQGLVWVTMWWSCGDGTATSSVGLRADEFEKVTSS